MTRFARDNSLTLFFTVLFAASVVGQSVVGERVFNEDALAHHEATLSWASYLTSAHFAQAVVENWQSEFLQFTMFILAAVWFVQRGSAESKHPDAAGLESDEEQRVGRYASADAPAWARAAGLKRWVYSNSLLLAMASIFVACWLVQSVAGWAQFNEERRAHQQATVAWSAYAVSADFWEDTLQNWQSEFLAVGVMAIFTVYLRQQIGRAHV